jgi:PAS domain S-box-containing protein
VLDNEKYLYVNRSAATSLGYDDPGELIGKDAFAHVAPEDREKVRSTTLRRQRGESPPSRYNFRLISKDGVGIDVEAHVSLTEFEGKTVSLAVNRDVTDQKKMERELRETNRALEERVKEMRCLFEAIRGTQEEESVEELGPRIVELLVTAMYIPEKAAPVLELGGKTFSHSRYREGMYLGPNVEIGNDGGVVGKISIYFTEDSPYYPPEKQSMINALAESLGGWYEGVRDANTLIEYTGRLEGMVEEKTSELLDAERMVTAGRIAAMVGHDLRAPLQTIKNAVYLLKRTPDKAEEMMELIEGSVDRAVRMLEELHNQTRDTPLRLEPVDLAEMIRTAVQEAAMTPEIQADLELYGDLGSTLLDGTKIRRVLDNLIKNAVEAMPEGGELTVSAKKTDGRIIVCVSDTGVGIADDERGKLFKPFHTTKKNGLGLGLSYCKRAVEAHGGMITVESEVGRGTRFTLLLPDSEGRGSADAAGPEFGAVVKEPVHTEQVR